MYAIESQMEDMTNKSTVRSLVYRLLGRMRIEAGVPGHKSAEAILENVSPLYYRNPINEEAVAAAVVVLTGYNGLMGDGVSYCEWQDFVSKRFFEKPANSESWIKKEIDDVRKDMKALNMKVPSEEDVLYAMVRRMGYELTGVGISD